MHIIARPKLAEFTQKHSQARDWLWAWWKLAARERWTSLDDVRLVYPTVDQVCRCLVFDKGNDFRLIVKVSYANEHTRGTLFIKHFLTHAQYDRGTWKKDCQ